MSGETEKSFSGWTVDTLKVYYEALRRGDERFESERDRRYSEVATEREKALKIKETADLAALGLARDIQIYKDEKANELRSQIERERGTYASKDDLVAALAKVEVQIRPLADYVTAQHGRRQGIGVSANVLAAVITVLIATIGLVAAVYFGTHP